MTLEEKINKWNLRFFESLWAMQVNFLAADINDLGLDQFLEEHRAYGIGYGLFAVAYFVAAMSIARVAPNPKVRRLTAAGVMVVSTALAFLFPSEWMFAALVIFALVYYLWPRKEGVSI
ncbi:hypothetical protein ACKFRH_02830 [Corynebacterium kefirresidentii]|uniref:hypothetical protein n=1 Tax=Corynebacterium TaxID=1716 RepID=UPI00190734F6|nr:MULTISPECIES: hypothetical protein [Corynebacterium]MCG7241627.1 hypothetical protein [Corynebacterium kefirresidentii]MCG7283902.1 hypothetical protein [Corynebacterium kefirresidentii]MCT2187178.1 hypothetical protein [Corynebacterium kefirresidentii]MDK8837362.1 hypothetical protein [Corynebacterium kefirresidentii]MDU3166216.1 hypothetical protein [Corynebacterium sp.]